MVPITITRISLSSIFTEVKIKLVLVAKAIIFQRVLYIYIYIGCKIFLNSIRG